MCISENGIDDENVPADGKTTDDVNVDMDKCRITENE
jgi:hypothetical protein